MKDSLEKLATAVGMLTLLVIFSSIALVSSGGWIWFAKFLESAAPAWIQAVGSIAAILGAFAIGSRQARSARILAADQERLSMLLRTSVVSTILAKAKHATTCLIVEIENGTLSASHDFLAAALTQCADALEALPFFELPSQEIAVEVITLPDVLRNAQKAVQPALEAARTWARNAEVGPQNADSIRNADRHLHQTLTRTGEQIAFLRKRPQSQSLGT